MKKNLIIVALVLVFVSLSLIDVQAQCPMCRMSAESNLADGGTAGKGLNKGILYMLSLPYLLVVSLGVLWYKNRRKIDEDFFIEPFSDN